MARAIRFGVQTPPQNVTWAELRSAWKTIEEAGFETAWVFDHFFPIFADPSGPCFEGWMALMALALETKKVEVGVLVTGNTYRHPAVLAKMAATLDHASNGRSILGIGAAWFEQEHNAYGIPFYTVPERIRRLGEALEVIKSLLTQKQTTFEGKYYQLKDAYCEPKPIRKPYPPIMIGGAGEKMTLKVVAKHADIWNTFGSPADFKQKLKVLSEHCASVGRRMDAIEVSWAGTAMICESSAQRDALLKPIAERWGRTPEDMAKATLVGTVDEIRARIEEFVSVGVTHFIMSAMPPYDLNGWKRFADEVIGRFR
jgi:F420-dependent oxidoreductase-like protein